MIDSAVVFNTTGEIIIIVHPDQVTPPDLANDPAFNPPGCVQVRIARSAYDLCPDHHALRKTLVPALLQKDPTTSTNAAALVTAEDARRAKQTSDALAAQAAHDKSLADYKTATGQTFDPANPKPYYTWAGIVVDPTKIVAVPV